MASDLFTPLMRGVFLPALGLLFLNVLEPDRSLQAAGPVPRAAEEVKQRVDLIELNHYYDCQGKHQFDQVIFYEWSPDFRRFHVIAWSLVEGDLKRLPRRLPGSGLTSVTWFDRDAKVHREVLAKLYRETWSQSDPERTNKRWIEEKDRLCLVRLPDRTTR